MKHGHPIAIAICALAAAAMSAFAAESGGHGAIDLFGSRWGERWGGGFRLGGEYIFDGIHYGIGGRLGVGVYSGNQKKMDTGVDAPFPFELYVPVYVTDNLTVYGGGGFSVHLYRANMEGDDFLDYTGHGEVTEAAFLGLRYCFKDSSGGWPFLFCEYRQDFGEITVKRERNVYNSRTRRVDKIKEEAEVDMSGGRLLIGIGARF